MCFGSCSAHTLLTLTTVLELVLSWWTGVVLVLFVLSGSRAAKRAITHACQQPGGCTAGDVTAFRHSNMLEL